MLFAAPSSRASGFAPRAFAADSVSKISAPPPSPVTNPLRVTSNGRLSPVAESAPTLSRLCKNAGQIAASPAITTTASAIPLRSSIVPIVIASPPDEQAVLTVRLGPVIWCMIENWHAARLPMHFVSSFGSADCPRTSMRVCVFVMIVSPCSARGHHNAHTRRTLQAALRDACSAAAYAYC